MLKAFYMYTILYQWQTSWRPSVWFPSSRSSAQCLAFSTRSIRAAPEKRHENVGSPSYPILAMQRRTHVHNHGFWGAIIPKINNEMLHDPWISMMYNDVTYCKACFIIFPCSNLDFETLEVLRLIRSAPGIPLLEAPPCQSQADFLASPAWTMKAFRNETLESESPTRQFNNPSPQWSN